MINLLHSCSIIQHTGAGNISHVPQELETSATFQVSYC